MIIVDGYNLIGQAAGTLSGLTLEKERTALFRQVEQLAAVTGEKFLVVFDGSALSKEQRGAQKLPGKNLVSIAFSKSGQTADSWILAYLSRRQKGSVTLVTRDRELGQKAKKLGFPVAMDLGRLEAKAQPYTHPLVPEAQTGGDLLSSLSRGSREALAQAAKKLKKQ